jgi:hypothetical protein
MHLRDKPLDDVARNDDETSSSPAVVSDESRAIGVRATAQLPTDPCCDHPTLGYIDRSALDKLLRRVHHARFQFLHTNILASRRRPGRRRPTTFQRE